MGARRIELVIPEDSPPERIDKFLASQLEHISRTRIQQLIDEDLIRVNGSSLKSNHIVAPGDQIEITIPEAQKTEIIAEEIALDIVYEDDYLLVVNKSAGMVVHPAFGHTGGTLVNALLYHCRDLSGINGELRPGIVHRLDKDTSGLLVVAKADETHRQLSEQFSNRTIDRTYLAILWGAFARKQGRIETSYGRSQTNRKKMSVLSEGKIAITTYKILEEFPLLSLAELKLETGRTHQIRVHMAHLGHPVFSDYVYGGRNRHLSILPNKEKLLASQYLECLPRHALHAQILGFVHPATGERLSFSSSIPDDISALLTLARAPNAPI
jgi:23S rRNA pseudouridine1911/1915/1917 synthase